MRLSTRLSRIHELIERFLLVNYKKSDDKSKILFTFYFSAEQEWLREGEELTKKECSTLKSCQK